MHTIELTCREQCFAPRFHFFHIFMLKESLVHMQRWEHQFRNVELFHACAVIIGLLRTAQLTGQMQLELILEMNVGIMIFLPDQQIGYTIIRGCHIKDVGVLRNCRIICRACAYRGQLNRRNRMAENGIVLGSCGYKTA